MPERVRKDDLFRDPTGSAINTNAANPDNLTLESDEVPFTDPTVQTVTKTFTVPSRTALQNQASTAAVVLDDENMTVTSVTYTPAGNRAAPTAGNSRAYVVTGTEGTIASFTFSSTSSAFVSATPIAFTVNIASVKEAETLNFASTITGSSGILDPGGTLTVVYTI